MVYGVKQIQAPYHYLVTWAGPGTATWGDEAAAARLSHDEASMTTQEMLQCGQAVRVFQWS